MPGAALGRHPGQPRQLQPGDDHDRPRVRRSHLRRADHGGVRRARHRPTSRARQQDRRAAGDTRRPDRSEHGRRAVRKRRVGALRRRADRCRLRGYPARRGPPAVQGHRRQGRRRIRQLPCVFHDGGSHRDGRGARAAGRRATLVYDGRAGLRPRSQRRRSAPDGRRRACCVSERQRADRGVDLRLEGIRARAYARRSRQRGRRLLDRERRPDGRAHRRLGHRCARDDADRPRVPAVARPRYRNTARGGRRHRRLQHPVRGQPRRRPGHRDRDEPTGVALVRAGVEGHRLPDRQDRRQAGDRLHARRDPQRHHQGDPGLLRADPGLRGGQGAAVRVREVPRR